MPIRQRASNDARKQNPFITMWNMNQMRSIQTNDNINLPDKVALAKAEEYSKELALCPYDFSVSIEVKTGASEGHKQGTIRTLFSGENVSK